MAGLYLHIPFCKQACHYCDFHFSTDRQHLETVLSAMRKELLLQRDFLNEPLETIYLGGGTPSLLPNDKLEALLSEIRKHYPLSGAPEITLEANPDDLSPGKLAELHKVGVNRLSIGVQSFEEGILRYLNRAHGPEAAHACLRESRAAGFTNISLDLIYAIPGLSLSQWKETLEQALSYLPEHISSYALTIEDRTVLGHWQKKGKLRVVDEELAAQQFEMMQRMLEEAGYEHYEISNFARPGFYSRHNTSYWLQRPYLGIGPSAHSYDGLRRLINVRNNAAYTRSIEAGKLPHELEWLTPENKINEYILTRLRTKWGCDLDALRELGDDLMTRCGVLLKRYDAQGLITVSNGTVLLTKRGMLLADQLTEDLMIV